MRRQLIIWLLVGAGCLGAMGTKAACGSSTRFGLSGTLTATGGDMRGEYSYDGSQGKRNVQGYLQWKPYFGYGKWFTEGDPTAASSSGADNAASGVTKARLGGGWWRIRVTSTDESGNPAGYWVSRAEKIQGKRFNY